MSVLKRSKFIYHINVCDDDDADDDDGNKCKFKIF